LLSLSVLVWIWVRCGSCVTWQWKRTNWNPSEPTGTMCVFQWC
jgi:hypothetical protein